MRVSPPFLKPRPADATCRLDVSLRPIVAIYRCTVLINIVAIYRCNLSSRFIVAISKQIFETHAKSFDFGKRFPAETSSSKSASGKEMRLTSTSCLSSRSIIDQTFVSEPGFLQVSYTLRQMFPDFSKYYYSKIAQIIGTTYFLNFQYI